MNRNAIAIYEPVASRRTCIHFWVIESASGPFSRGTCRRCGTTREFKNYPTDCTLEYTTFGELIGDPGKDETELNGFMQVEYKNGKIADLEEDEYEREPDALCAAA